MWEYDIQATTRRLGLDSKHICHNPETIDMLYRRFPLILETRAGERILRGSAWKPARLGAMSAY